MLNSNMMNIPFTYLGIKIEDNPQSYKLWEAIVGKIKKRTSDMERKQLNLCRENMSNKVYPLMSSYCIIFHFSKCMWK